MKIKAHEQRILTEWIEGRISLRNAADKMKVHSASVYVKGFHYLKNKFINNAHKD